MTQLYDLKVVPLSMVSYDGMQRILFEYTINRSCKLELRIIEDNNITFVTTVAFTSGSAKSFAMVPVRTKAGIVRFTFWDKGNSVSEKSVFWEPPREWDFYIMISSHTDIGLHNSQYIQRFNSSRFLDMAAALCDETENREEHDRYRYTIEGTWFWVNYPNDRGNDAAEEFAEKYLRTGKIGICGGIAGNHTQNYGYEELCHAVAERERLKREWDVSTHTMSMIDNNGISWAMVGPLADAGYENILFSPNHWNPLPSNIWVCDTTIPGYTWNTEAGGGGSRCDIRMDSALPQLFWWQSEDGVNRVLVWAANAYGHGGDTFGFRSNSKPSQQVLRQMEYGFSMQLPKLERKTEINVWLIVDYSDDQAPDIGLTDTLAMWNAKWRFPRLRTLGNPDLPFNAVRERFGEKIPVLRGEITGGWYQHPLSAADILGRKLNADRALAQAETCASFAAICDPSYPIPAVEFRHAWDALLWHDEHSYGTSGYQGQRVYETWMQHRAWIECAEETAEREIRSASESLSRSINGKGLFALNTSSFPRCERVRFHDKQAEITLPACGYVFVPEKLFQNIEVSKVDTEIPPEIENEKYVVLFSGDGSIRSIFDKDLHRELLQPEGGANRMLYTQDNHQSFSSASKACFKVLRSKMGSEVISDCDDPVSGAHIQQSVKLYSGDSVIRIENRLSHIRDMFNSDRYKRYLYYAFPFAVPNAKRICNLNGCEAEYAVDLTGHGTDTYMNCCEWCCSENGEFGTALFLRDSSVIEFDHIHPDKTDFGEAGEDSSVFNYVANDWLQMHLTGGSYLGLTLRYGITSYAGNHIDAGVPKMAEAFCLPVYTMELCGDSNLEESVQCSVLEISGDQRLVGCKRANNGLGLIVDLYGKRTDANVSCRGEEGERCTIDECEAKEEQGYGISSFRILGNLRTMVRKYEEGMDEAGIPKTVGTVYTGLIDKPRAARGGRSGHLYLLWGSSMESDFSYYELFRSEQKGFSPDGKTYAARIEKSLYRVDGYIDEGLKPHTEYFYRVRAVNAKGIAGPFSEEFSGITKEE